MKLRIFPLHPKRIFLALDEIDREPPSYRLSRPEALRRVFWTLACVSFCLLLIHYLKFFTSMTDFLQILSLWQDRNPHYWQNRLQASGFLQLIGYGWWTFWHLLGYVVIPYFLVRFLFREKFIDMGWKLQNTTQHWRGYLLLLSPILFFIFLVSFRQDFLHHYPFYKLSHRSWFDLLAWEFLYLLQFVCLEFFFRGFMLHALRPAIGANAIWVMCVPYLMIHFPKLWLEATGAILFGLFLGILALRSRSIWGGFFVHAGVAVTMDLASLIQQEKLPASWWPAL